jgi:cbb3-type cytochrome oxidase subunit 3
MLREFLTTIDLSLYAEIAMVIFLVVFVAIVWRTLSMGTRMDVDAAARMPLETEPDDEALEKTREVTQ